MRPALRKSPLWWCRGFQERPMCRTKLGCPSGVFERVRMCRNIWIRSLAGMTRCSAIFIPRALPWAKLWCTFGAFESSRNTVGGQKKEPPARGGSGAFLCFAFWAVSPSTSLTSFAPVDATLPRLYSPGLRRRGTVRRRTWRCCRAPRGSAGAGCTWRCGRSGWSSRS